jgi:hypothetical protein
LAVDPFVLRYRSTRLVVRPSIPQGERLASQNHFGYSFVCRSLSVVRCGSMPLLRGCRSWRSMTQNGSAAFHGGEGSGCIRERPLLREAAGAAVEGSATGNEEHTSDRVHAYALAVGLRIG